MIAESTRARIAEAHVAAFVEQGYLVVEGLVGEDELRELEQDVLALARGAYETPALRPVPPEVPDEEALRRVLCIHQPHYVSPVIERYVRHPGIAAVLSRIVGAHLPTSWWDGAVKCMQSMYFVKSPGKPGQSWHQDEVYIPTRDRSLCGAWIAVDDATVANGCLWVLPGSHRAGVLYPQREPLSREECEGGESHGFDESAEIPVEVPRGSVVFFNGYLLHRSKRNRSRIYRRALVNHYMTAQSLLPWFGQEGVPPAQRDHRAVVMVSGRDPHAWRGYQPGAPEAVYVRGYDVERAAAAESSIA